MPRAALGRAKKTLNTTPFLPLDQAMDMETSITTEGMVDPEAAARAKADGLAATQLARDCSSATSTGRAMAGPSSESHGSSSGSTATGAEASGCPADAAKGLVGMPCACAPTGVMASSNKSPMKEASNVRRGNRNALPTDGFGIKYRRIGESAEGAIRPGALS